MPDYLGLGDRLDASPSETMANAAFGDELRAAPYLWRGMSHADMAQALALQRAGTITTETAGSLLKAILALDKVPLDQVKLDPFVGDVYNNRDKLLQQLAPDAAGHLHAGRSRREATTLGWLVECRRLVFELGESVSRLVDTIADVASDNALTVMPDFTYLHRAHATSLGHYLLAHGWPFARHLDRVQAAAQSLNVGSPAGSGSTNGTSIPLDRHYLASLLGFEDSMWHTRDSMWAPDVAIELSALALQVMTTIDRLAEELQLWTTEAFAFVTLADEHCRTSVIMPHKKNPYALTHLRGAARRTTGSFVGVTSSVQTASGQPDNRTVAYHDVPAMLELAGASARLLDDVIAGAHFEHAALAEAASDPLMASTEVCDYLTVNYGLSNRTAHQIVGRTVRDALDNGERTISATALSAAAAAHEVDLDIDVDQLDRLLDPVAIVTNRRTHGGAGPDSVKEMSAALHAIAASMQTFLQEQSARTYAERLIALVRDQTDTNQGDK